MLDKIESAFVVLHPAFVWTASEAKRLAKEFRFHELTSPRDTIASFPFKAMGEHDAHMLDVQ